jgi:hypothetical protein
LLSQALYEQAGNITAENILFKDGSETYFERPKLVIEKIIPQQGGRDIFYTG